MERFGVIGIGFEHPSVCAFGFAKLAALVVLYAGFKNLLLSGCVH